MSWKYWQAQQSSTKRCMNLPDQQFIVYFFKSCTGAPCLTSNRLPYAINGRKKKIMVYLNTERSKK